MQYAVTGGQRVLATPKAKAQCPICFSDVIAKCGSRTVHHWAHTVDRDCDPWWENETPWHREWKEKFPAECREISHTAPDGEIHRADVKSPTGIVVELQNSPMTDAERISRENFYQNIVWIVNGASFEKNFDLYHMLPDPQSELARDLVWHKSRRGSAGTTSGIFYRRSENAEGSSLVRAHGYQKISKEVESAWNGHFQYDWVRPRQTWLDSTHPVYIDFGKDFLFKLEHYEPSQLACVKLLAKEKVIHDIMNERLAIDIGTRFYAIN